MGALAAGLVLTVAAPAAAAGWTAPAAIPAGSGAAPITRPVIGATSTGVVVAAWRRGRAVHAAARYVGGSWSAPRRIASASAGVPRLVSQGATVALGVVAGPGGRVRVARWTRGLAPVVDGPGGGARDLRLAVLPGGEVVAVYRRGGAVVWSASPFWSARPRRGPWLAPARLFAGAASPALATDGDRAVLATALRPTARGTEIVAALRRVREPFGPRTAIRPLGARWAITSATPAIRPDGRTGVVIAVRGPGGRGALLATVAGARQPPVRVSATGVRPAGPVARWPSAIPGASSPPGARRAGAARVCWRPRRPTPTVTVWGPPVGAHFVRARRRSGARHRSRRAHDPRLRGGRRDPACARWRRWAARAAGARRGR